MQTILDFILTLVIFVIMALGVGFILILSINKDEILKELEKTDEFEGLEEK